MKAGRLVVTCAFAAALVLALAGCTQATASSGAADGSSIMQSSVSTQTVSTAATTTTSASPTVDADYVSRLEDGAYLVDVRTAEEYAAGHIPGALNASYPKSTGGPCQSEENASSFRSAWAKLGVPADAHVVVYCRTGVRAAAAASALREDGYANVEVYEGSWTDWTSDPARPVEA